MVRLFIFLPPHIESKYASRRTTKVVMTGDAFSFFIGMSKNNRVKNIDKPPFLPSDKEKLHRWEVLVEVER